MTNLNSLVGFGAGGGGGSSSSGDAIKPTILYDEDQVGTWEAGWDEHTTYCRVNQYSPRGQFAIHSHTFSDSSWTPTYYQNRLRIAPFTVNQSTGAMTWGTKGNAFLNSSGYVHSTMSYGFGGSYGVNWGHSAWGSGNTHYYGGCVWRIVNNAIVGGQSTGNSNYASENTSNGNLPIYESGGTYYYNIPNGDYTSLGYIDSSGNNGDWANQNETNHSYYTYIYRCVGKTVGESQAGVMVNSQYIQAMNASGSGGTVGTQFTEGGGQSQSGGIGFELESGVQVFFTCRGTYIRGSKTGGLTYKATVSEHGASASGVPSIATTASDLAIVGVVMTNFTYVTSGYAAKEDDTFYFYSDSTNNDLIKFKIRMPTSSTVTLERLGAIDMSDIGGTSNLSSYRGFSDITGNDDQFLVCSYRTGSGKPSHTIVVDNPIKDA